MKIEYNAPVILTYALLASVILLVNQLFVNIMPVFTVYPEFNLTDPLWYFRLFSHVLGHGGWEHLVSNFTIILLVGPILEEKYGSRDLLLMIVVTAFVIGLLQVFFFPNPLLGASGIAFMLILLASYTRTRSGGIPLSFLLIVVLFLGKEVYQALSQDDQISQFAHIIGGILGDYSVSSLKAEPRAKESPKPQHPAKILLLKYCQIRVKSSPGKIVPDKRLQRA